SIPSAFELYNRSITSEYNRTGSDPIRSRAHESRYPRRLTAGHKWAYETGARPRIVFNVPPRVRWKVKPYSGSA
ncbi:MAG: hypothetical protein AAGU11_16165, partial [Syntrophobacteraceae bacterium]